ncbi:hypothetical protein [Paenibacillus polymyxa]|uniref:RNA helicase n=1 Tax=Paenibacillus polymyxa TaxID=1406 RepID=A0ABX2ZEJ2_PAEPO|nr:hypothetical protein [Paenibacillus polymyxa]ODA08708.1 hypothetical protein A7312_04710 [Paenibacillus polymyxa]
MSQEIQELRTIQVGLVMPIAPIGECTAEHWLDIKGIITDAVSNIPGYQSETKIVSESDSIGVIHKRIVQGLYNSDIVICDVSCKNPNVMFELGMRLAFDKPTVIIKDDLTDYSFDTSAIEHLEYPRDLRFNKIVDFKNLLARKVKATYEDGLNDPTHSPFLKNFGEFTVATIEQTSISPDKLIIEMLNELQSDIALLKRERTRNTATKKYEGLEDVIELTRVGIANYFSANGIDSQEELNSKLNKKDLINFIRQFLNESFSGRVPNSAVPDIVDLLLHSYGYKKV